MKFLFLEPFFGGSHRDFLEGLVAESRHDVDMLTMPARFWKWRMRGAALFFLKKIDSLEKYDGIIATSLMSLADFKAIYKHRCPPLLVYFHENQITYPIAPGEKMDYQFGFTDITTAITADRVIFNSKTHLNAFVTELPDFIKKMPEYEPKWVMAEIKKKAGSIYPGCQFPVGGQVLSHDKSLPPLIIWNHRWEHDKNPEQFFDVLDTIKNRNIDFRLALLGQKFTIIPKCFILAKEHFKDHIVQYGYVDSKEEYQQWLKNGAIIISTASQENFGIAVVEAIRYGCIPLLPNRLSYPEIIPKAFHNDFLYSSTENLIDKLSDLLLNFTIFADKREKLSNSMECYAWENMIKQYDNELEKLAEIGKS